MPIPAPLVLPQISISPAPPQEEFREPHSPFSSVHSQDLKEPDSPRPALLSPPPTASAHLRRQLSPLRPDDTVVAGRGIERERFEALLRASRERNAAVGAKKSPDLRKEIAVKAHKSKQMERRALFLAKLQAPPSPSAANAPKTPPESPAIFHYSLPSPGLESPLAVFELLAMENPHEHSQVWVEQVDFRIPGQGYTKIAAPRKALPVKRGMLPSLDQITARLSAGSHGVPASHEPHTARLPAFLRSRSQAEDAPPIQTPVDTKQRHALSAVGRLQFPKKKEEALPELKIVSPSPRAPCMPSSPVSPKLQITTTVVPRISSRSPDALTETNLQVFVAESRERMAKDMLSRLRRRTLPPTHSFPPVPVEERKLRRHSAPPELPLRERASFVKPVLNLPGAF
ncbi:hypothetical protein BXZ70DRAFT_162281 [Cristinia sonorae]|uniref:Uncharacterized protein n=1 Tax=Cristinia sonorae TaxID=1940300 RepID=A0A8K0UPH6_9AGAR|nr:hypothetical protein BXZ70DRAFT_162281 [Cristinia sonorae]